MYSQSRRRSEFLCVHVAMRRESVLVSQRVKMGVELGSSSKDVVG